MKFSNPPKSAERFLRWYCDSELFEEISGDLEEAFFYRCKKLGVRKAKIMYWLNVIMFFQPFALKKRKPNHYSSSNLIDMYYNYFKIALRNFQKNQAYTFLNIAGLTLGMVCFFLITLFVWDEKSYDQFHESADRVYRVIDDRVGKDGKVNHLALTAPTYAPMMKQEFPEVEESMRMINFFGKTRFKIDEIDFLEEGGLFAPSTFFDMFTLPLKYGNPETALVDPNSVILTPELAEKFFPQEAQEKLLGKSFEIEGDPVKITGIFECIPENFHLDFKWICSFSSLDDRIAPQRMESWLWHQFYTYLKLKEEASVETLREKIPAFLEKYSLPQTETLGASFQSHLQNVKDIHLHSAHLEWEIAKQGNALYVNALSIVALFILLIACINFVNLSTALSKEEKRLAFVKY